mmetsp:Transcript_16841/g.36570  ORF Transcript_16841/g.36570 Transcript_16841/m.36570 type:complete len:234 (+) Transcript_16841:314-1015(+)
MRSSSVTALSLSPLPLPSTPPRAPTLSPLAANIPSISPSERQSIPTNDGTGVRYRAIMPVWIPPSACNGLNSSSAAGSPTSGSTGCCKISSSFSRSWSSLNARRSAHESKYRWRISSTSNASISPSATPLRLTLSSSSSSSLSLSRSSASSSSCLRSPMLLTGRSAPSSSSNWPRCAFRASEAPRILASRSNPYCAARRSFAASGRAAASLLAFSAACARSEPGKSSESPPTI